MPYTYDRLCACQAHLPRRPMYDARGIFCGYVCDGCEDEKRKGYREDIFTDPNYWHDEEL